jgi:AraC-like DNA-binding protein/mannose-6-phosphate isomerase-like protein (cupin superfamily)
MRVRYEKVSFPTNASIRLEDVEGFGAPYSYHPEYEIVYILSGSGIRLIGQKPEAFEAGDLVLLGPNVYHWWKPKENPREIEKEKAIVVQWDENLFQNSLHNCPELNCLKKLEQKSLHGLHFKGKQFDYLREKIVALKKMKSSYRFIRLIEILLDMHEAENVIQLDGYIGNPNKSSPPIIERAIVYILENLHKNISQESVADHFNLSNAHFSRIFKKSTSLSFPIFVHHNRISSICQAMHQNDKNIADLAFTYGYDNLSTFNRAFKEKMGITPLTYRKAHYN